MISNIKAMINSKQEFLESSRIIFEDAVESELEELILLGEAGEDDLALGEEKGPEDSPEPKDDEEPIEDLKTDEEDPTENEPKMDDPEEPGDPEEPTIPGGDSDVLDSPLTGEDDLPTPGEDDTSLPEPIGRQTGEPVNDDIEDFLNVTIDLRSNTLTDVLPTPPDNAGEAIEDDVLGATVDSGFGGEEASMDGAETPPVTEEDGDDLLNSSVEESSDEADDGFLEKKPNYPDWMSKEEVSEREEERKQYHKGKNEYFRGEKKKAKGSKEFMGAFKEEPNSDKRKEELAKSDKTKEEGRKRSDEGKKTYDDKKQERISDKHGKDWEGRYARGQWDKKETSRRKGHLKESFPAYDDDQIDSLYESIYESMDSYIEESAKHMKGYSKKLQAIITGVHAGVMVAFRSVMKDEKYKEIKDNKDVLKQLITELNKEELIGNNASHGNNMCFSVTGTIDWQHGAIAKADKEGEKSLWTLISKMLKEVEKVANKESFQDDSGMKVELDDEHGNFFWLVMSKKKAEEMMEKTKDLKESVLEIISEQMFETITTETIESMFESLLTESDDDEDKKDPKKDEKEDLKKEYANPLDAALERLESVRGELQEYTEKKMGKETQSFLKGAIEDQVKKATNVINIKDLNDRDDEDKSSKEKKESTDQFGDDVLSEAITLGGEAPADAGGGDANAAAAPDAGLDASADASAGGGESDVTAAVRDKVSEADTPAEDMDMGAGLGGGNKDEILKRLGTITKNLEDAKKAIMDHIE